MLTKIFASTFANGGTRKFILTGGAEIILKGIKAAGAPFNAFARYSNSSKLVRCSSQSTFDYPPPSFLREVAMVGKAGGMGDKIVASMWPSSARRAGRVQSYDCLAKGLHKINSSPNQALRLYVTNKGNISNPLLFPCRKTSPQPRQSVVGHASAQKKFTLTPAQAEKARP